MRIFTNREVKRITIVFVCIYTFIYLAGSWQQQLLFYLAATNALTSLLAIACWGLRNIRIPPRRPELREIVFLLAEGLFAAGAFHMLAISCAPAWLRWMQYIVYALHFLTLLLMMIFVFTFRIKKLF